MPVYCGDNISEVTLYQLKIKYIIGKKYKKLQCTTVTNFGSDGKFML